MNWSQRIPFSSIASTGFALTAYGIGAERGYISREDAAARPRACLEFYWNAPQGPAVDGVSGHKGFFYHFLKNDDGTRFGKTELSTVDTSLLLGGVLFAQSYFDRDNPTEAAIRDLAEKIYTRVDWTFAQRENSTIPSANGGSGKAIAMGEVEGLVKTVFDAKTGELLGAHMIGAEVTELIQGFGIAKSLETTEADLMHAVFPHPTLSEMMHESVLDAYGQALHM